MKDPRRQYRTPQPFRGLVSVTVLRPAGTETSVSIVDLSMHGLGFLVAPDRDPDFAVDEIIHVRLASPHLDETLTTPGRVCRSARDESGTRYGIVFLDWLGIRAQLPAELKPAFNQRTGRRLGVRPFPEIQIEDRSGAFRCDATMVNLSANGLCFAVREAAADALEAYPQIQVTLTVPGSSDQLTFSCKIRDRQSAEDRVSFNVCFVEEHTVDFEAKRDRLAQLVGELERRTREGTPAKDTAGNVRPRD